MKAIINAEDIEKRHSFDPVGNGVVRCSSCSKELDLRGKYSHAELYEDCPVKVGEQDEPIEQLPLPEQIIEADDSEVEHPPKYKVIPAPTWTNPMECSEWLNRYCEANNCRLVGIDCKYYIFECN